MDTRLNPKTVRNRVVEMRLIRAGDLLDHDGNWRIHPLYQREALDGRLETVGITDVLKVYPSARADGRLVIIDGHLRKATDPDLFWPCVILDLTDEEADEELAFHDAIGGWAETNALALNALLEQMKVENEKVQSARERLRGQIDAQVEIAKRALGDPSAKPAREGVYDGFRLAPSVKVTIAIGDDLDAVERALKATGLKNRAAALGAICSHYLRTQGETAAAKSAATAGEEE
jgi:hypothetical protein